MSITWSNPHPAPGAAQDQSFCPGCLNCSLNRPPRAAARCQAQAGLFSQYPSLSPACAGAAGATQSLQWLCLGTACTQPPPLQAPSCTAAILQLVPLLSPMSPPRQPRAIRSGRQHFSFIAKTKHQHWGLPSANTKPPLFLPENKLFQSIPALLLCSRWAVVSTTSPARTSGPPTLNSGDI